ncbi:MAG TPA: YceI family protein [Chryseolinea sp.]|nr:YceI family protein [Chryseolinea sp.]
MKFIYLLFFSFIVTVAISQKYTVEKGSASFFSHATVEDIAAKNEKIAGLFNSSTGDVAFSIPNKEFQFAKSLMKEHFNEKYMQTEKFPKSTFQGKVTGFDLNSNEVQQAKAKGKLTIHGQTKDVEVLGTIEKQGDRLIFKAKFIAKLEDYKISIPQLLWQNIAEQVEVTVDLVFMPQ